MTELEKIEYAKGFMDKLANGINPLDGTPIPDGDIVNNVRLSRCFFYVSDILRRVIENGGTELVRTPKSSKPKKKTFELTEAERSRIVISDVPVTVSEITHQLNALIDLNMVNAVLNQIGPVAPRSQKADETRQEGQKQNESYSDANSHTVRKFYRDVDSKRIAGVCSGLALYLNIDVTLVRIIFLVALICGSAGLWIYIVLWIVAPEARTAAEKCELRGIPATAENIRRFTENR